MRNVEDVVIRAIHELTCHPPTIGRSRVAPLVELEHELVEGALLLGLEKP